MKRPRTTKKVAVKAKPSQAKGDSVTFVLAKLRSLRAEVVRTIDELERGLVRDHGRLRQGRGS